MRCSGCGNRPHQRERAFTSRSPRCPQASLPPWVDHIRTRSAVFDGDNVFLNGQDRILAEAGQAEEGASWRK